MPSKPLRALAALVLIPMTACATPRQTGTPGIVPRNANGEPILNGPEGIPVPRSIPAA